MSSAETTEQFVREFPVELIAGDGRNLEARVVPYNQTATVADPPHFLPYQEMFAPGAFRRQLSAASRLTVLLNFEHEAGIRGTIGRATALDERGDGLYGSFRMLDGHDGDKALDLVHAGVLTGMSIEFAVKPGGTEIRDGVRVRKTAHLDKVALCRTPAYQEAQVLAVRAEPVVVKPVLNERIDALLAEVGVVVAPRERTATIPCPTCSGSGTRPDGTTCETCGGGGTIYTGDHT